MSERSPEQISEQIRELLDSLYRVDSGRIPATLIRLLGDFDLAEEPFRLSLGHDKLKSVGHCWLAIRFASASSRDRDGSGTRL